MTFITLHIYYTYLFIYFTVNSAENAQIWNCNL